MKKRIMVVFISYLSVWQFGNGMINEIAADAERSVLFQASDDKIAQLDEELAKEEAQN